MRKKTVKKPVKKAKTKSNSKLVGSKIVGVFNKILKSKKKVEVTKGPTRVIAGPIILSPKVLKFKTNQQAQDYMELKHLRGWKIFRNVNGGFYLHKGHFNLANELHKERQRFQTTKAMVLGFGALLLGFALTSFGQNTTKSIKTPGTHPIKKKVPVKANKKTNPYRKSCCYCGAIFTTNHLLRQYCPEKYGHKDFCKNKLNKLLKIK